MSRSFNALPGVKYFGTPPRFKPTMLTRPFREAPASCILQFDWLLYGAGANNPTIRVDCDLTANQGGQVVNPMSVIQTVVIDNSGNPASVYAVFDDFFTVVAGPYETVTENIFTNSLSFYVVGTGFTGGPQPQTRIWLSNVLVNTGVSPEVPNVTPQYLASVFLGNPILNQTPFRTLAAGDLTKQSTINLATNAAAFTDVSIVAAYNDTSPVAGVSSNVTFQLTGIGQYIYITALTFFVSILWQPPSVTTGLNANVGYPVTLKFSDSLGSINYSVPFSAVRVAAGTAQAVNNNILQLSGLQIKCRADATFTFSTTQSIAFNGVTTGTGSRTFNDIATASMIVQYTARDENTL